MSVINPESMRTTMHVLKMTKVGDEEVPTPINSQSKLDEVKLTLIDASTGEIEINYPYNIATAISCRKTMAIVIGEKETTNNSNEGE